MEVLVNLMLPILVLMFVGTGFIYVNAMQDLSSIFCFRVLNK